MDVGGPSAILPRVATLLTRTRFKFRSLRDPSAILPRVRAFLTRTMLTRSFRESRALLMRALMYNLSLAPSLYTYMCLCFLCRSEGFALTGYVVPGCVEDGTWMLWGNSSVVAVVAAVVVLARYFLDNFSNKSLFLVIFH